MRTPTRDLFAGCLVGQCLGDALGHPVEGMDAPYCMHFLNDLNKRGVKAWSRNDRHPPGQYTDDSQLARELLLSLLEHDGFNEQDFANSMVRLFLDDKVVGRGMATHNAVMRLANGQSWEKSGEDVPAAGNGTAMRAAPVGLYYYKDVDSLCNIAHRQGFGTHKDPRCSAGSIAVAGAVTLALTMDTLESGSFCNQLADWMEPFHTDFAAIVRTLPDWMNEGFQKAAQHILDLESHGEEPGGWPGVSPYVISSVTWSLFAFLLNPEDYWKAVQMAIVVGGDVDTTGAMTGAIAGARVGLHALPGDFARLVHDRDEWGYDALVELAGDAYDRVC